MSAIRFPNPPIVEAVIDIHCELKPSVSLETIKELSKKLQGQYMQHTEIRRIERTVSFGKDTCTETKDCITGYRFKSADEKQIAQFKLNGFSFSRLKPYPHWELFRDNAKEMWAIYSLLGINNITRVAMRYINVIDIPVPVDNMESYVNGLPNTPPQMMLSLDTFFNRVQVRDVANGFNAIITQALQPPKTPNAASVLLDIDVFKMQMVNQSFDTVWEMLEQMREFKNKLFMMLLTEKVKREVLHVVDDASHPML